MSAPTPLKLCYEDKDIVVIDKPANIPSVPTKSREVISLYELVKQSYPSAQIVHRLDTRTSGLIIFALSKRAQRNLSQSFAAREVSKDYSAVCLGTDLPDHGIIDLPLGVDWPNKPKQKIDFIYGKPSLTFFSVLERQTFLGRCVVRLHPVTGRTHQLRVHLAALGHPIVGCPLYGRSTNFYSSSERLLLHASALRFTHPITQITIAIECTASFYHSPKSTA